MENKWWRVRASLDWWYEVIIKGIFIALLPTIIIPAIIVGFVINYVGLTIDSLLAIIFLGQFYIIWAQLEVALRQTRLSTLEYEPEFKIEIKKSSKPVVVADDERNMKGFTYFPYDATLKNVGKHLARNVSAEINILAVKPPYRNIKPPVRQFGDIGADKSHFVYGFMEEDLKNTRVTIKFKYQNILGVSGSVGFISEPEFCQFIGIERVKMPGILLNSFEKLLSIRKGM
jgi:hypothetical protein